jgi:dipeptidyl aminopeptidase/acylaminoacyl peptidase
VKSNNRALRLLASIALLAPVLVQAQDRKPITHEDMWLMPRVGAPAVSPDGRFAVFSVVEPSYDKDKQASDLWLVATDGKSEPRRLTQSRAPEAGQTWSADSKRIALRRSAMAMKPTRSTCWISPAAKRSA